MKLIYAGSYKRRKLYTEIRKALLIPYIVFGVVIGLLLIIPIGFQSKIFKNNSNMSNVVYVETLAGSGSAVYVGNNKLLTAAHVMEGMELEDVCNIQFQDPNNDKHVVHAVASLICKGSYDKTDKDIVNDYALLEIQGIDPGKITKPCQIGQSKNVKVKDKISVEGYPNGTYSFTEGIVNNIQGGAWKNNNFIVFDAVALGGNSGGALFDQNNNLIGIVTLTGVVPGVTVGQALAIKIDYIREKLSSEGYSL